MPIRPGPLQCIRNCPSCTSRVQDDDSSARAPEGEPKQNKVDFDEAMANLKGYANLMIDKKQFLCPFRTVQYHLGQLDLLKWRLATRKAPCPVIYVVGLTEINDLEYLKLILAKEKVEPFPSLVETRHNCCFISGDSAMIWPRSLRSCPPSPDSDVGEILSDDEILDSLEIFVDTRTRHQVADPGKDIILVPVVISKDHSERYPYGVGSLCVQIHEPYSLANLLRAIGQLPKPAEHILKHLHHDMSLNYPLLPSHIVAFLLMSCDGEICVADLIDHYEWLEKNRLALNLHFAFTGDSESVVNFGLYVLEKYIKQRDNNTFGVVNYDAMIDYMQRLFPNIAPLSIMAQSILGANYAASEEDDMWSRFEPDHKIVVRKDKTMELFNEIAEEHDESIPFRRPCVKMEDFADRTLDNITTHFRYLKVDSAMRFKRDNSKMRWGFDIEEDDYYREAQIDNPIFQDWINVTQSASRLKQLNICVNSMDQILDLAPSLDIE